MKLELTLGWEASYYSMMEPFVRVTLEGDQELVDDLYEHIRQFKPRVEHEYKEFVIE